LESIPEIRQLQGILRATTDRDSVRLLLARAYRETGTMEGRERALDLFHRIRPRYYDDYRYHQELALTYLEGERYDDARESMRKAAQRAPDAIRVRGDLAELMFRHALRTCEADAVKELLGMLNETLALAPHDRTALLYKSLALSLARSLDPSRGSESSLEARACTEAILRGDPTDRLALLLQGAQCLDLGEPERADRWFRRGLELSSPVYGAAFFVPVLCAPEAVLRQLAEAPPSLRDSLSTAFWDSRDPTPLTPVNENLLEYWKRLVLADLFFGQPENSLRGWQTPRGELFVRYGPPEAMSFARASFAEGEATVQRDLPLERRRSREVAPMTLRFQCPEQTWRYTFGGREIAFAFIDPTLHDRFIAASPGVVETFTRTAPAVLTEGFHGNIRNCFLGSAGTRGDGGRTRQAVVVGLPAGDATTDPWAGARIDVRLLDQVGHEQSSELHTVSVRSAQPLPLGVSLALIAEELLLAPGRYTAEVRVAAGARAGTYALPVEVRTFGRDSLQLSDLRLAFAAERADSGSGPQGQTTPNPTGLVPRGARLGVAFEVYNLFPAAGDRARYQVRYTVLPLAYAREYSRLLASGNRARDPVLQFGRLGGTFGGVTLEDGNYADVLFPPIETPLAPAARCRSSFRLETAGLREGTYALLVTVTDLNVNRMVSVRAPFSVLSEAAFRAALAVE
jgi:GWxTD domain-containing protein